MNSFFLILVISGCCGACPTVANQIFNVYFREYLFGKPIREHMNNILDKYKDLPISSDAPSFRFPDYKIIVGESGIEYFYFPNLAQPLVSVRAIYSFDLGKSPVPGGVYFATQLLKCGTSSRSALEFAEEADAIGATYNFNAGYDDVACSVVTLAEYTSRALELLIDAIAEPAFSAEETDRFRKKHIASILQEEADPNYLCRLAFNSVYYRKHPYSHPLYGTESSIASITATEARRIWFDVVASSTPRIVIAGNTPAEPIIAAFEDRFKGEAVNKPQRNRYSVCTEQATRIIIADKPSAPQTTLQIGRPSPPMLSPEYSAMQLANTLFGGFFMSVLNHKIREEMGLTYGIYSYIANRRNGSALIISSNLNKENTRRAIDCILEEMERFSREKCDPGELFTAQQYVLGSFLRSTETPQDVANLIHSCIVNGVGTDFYDNYYSFLASATPDTIAEVQSKYFRPEYLTVSMVGSEDFLAKEIAGISDRAHEVFVP